MVRRGITKRLEGLQTHCGILVLARGSQKSSADLEIGSAGLQSVQAIQPNAGIKALTVFYNESQDAAHIAIIEAPAQFDGLLGAHLYTDVLGATTDGRRKVDTGDFHFGELIFSEPWVGTNVDGFNRGDIARRGEPLGGLHASGKPKEDQGLCTPGRVQHHPSAHPAKPDNAILYCWPHKVI